MPSILLVSNPAIQFATYELLKNKFCKLSGSDTLPGSVYLAIGAMAKSLATLITYPLQIIQTKLRVSDGLTNFVQIGFKAFKS